MGDALTAALAYAKKNWHVLPVHGIRDGACTCGKPDCGSPGKHPRTRNGVKDATTDEKQIRSWFNVWGDDCNIAIATGSVSGLWVLDVDAGGEDTLNELEDDHGKRPDTPEAHTGKGLHVYFGTDARIPNKVRFAHGLDVRGDGGYVVAPPSIHISGSRYEWDAYLTPDTPLAEAPHWLLDAIGANGRNTTAGAPQRPPIDPKEILSGVPQGERNESLFRHACRLVGKGLSEVEVRSYTRLAAQAARPPLPDDELIKIVESAMKYQPAPEEPVPLDLMSAAKLPPFPAEVLAVADQSLADFVRDIAAVRQVPLDLPGMMVLSTLAACTSRRVRVKIGQSHSVWTNIYAAVSMEPGSRKSAVLRDVTAPLELIEAEELERIMPVRRQMLERQAADEGRIKMLRAKATKASDAECEKTLNEIACIQASMVEPVPEPRLIIGGDISMEKIGVLLAEHGERLALFDDEGGVFQMMAGLYNSGKMQLDIMLKCWAGDPHRVDRMGRESIHLKAPLLTVGLCVQPDVIQSLADQKAFRGRGLVGRFCYAIPRSNVGQRLYQERGLRADLADAYGRLVSDLYHALNDVEEPLRLSISGEALVIWRQFHDRIERDMVTGGKLADCTDWGSKLAGTVAGIAGTMHCIRYREEDPEMHAIGADIVLAAWAIGEYLVEHALVTFGVMRVDPDADLAQKILDWVKEEGLAEFSMKSLQRRFRSKSRQSEFYGALSILTERGYIERLGRPAVGSQGGRRAGAIYAVETTAVNSVFSRGAGKNCVQVTSYE